MANEPWVMSVPVISTVHMPGPFEPDRVRDRGDQPVAISGDGMFIYIGSEEDGNEYEGDSAWIQPVSRWLDKHPEWDGRWVCFSCVGDIVKELPEFTWL